MQQANRCAACGQDNPVYAAYCAGCGAPLSGADGDDLANAVTGAPVRQDTHPVQGLGDVRERVQQALPDLAATITQQMSRLSGMAADMQRQRGQQPVPPAIPPLLARIMAQSRVPVVYRAPLPAPVPIPARVAWFLFAGIWLTPIWIVACWLMMCTVAGMPIAARMVDLAPTVLTLRPVRPVLERWQRQRALRSARRQAQPNLALRAAYFVLVGWWTSLIWLFMAYSLALTGIGLPVGYAMFELTPTVAHLELR